MNSSTVHNINANKPLWGVDAVCNKLTYNVLPPPFFILGDDILTEYEWICGKAETCYSVPQQE